MTCGLLGIADEDIVEAWLYLLGRILVLRQERFELESKGFEWNKVVHREPGLDVAYSEAWIAVDEHHAVVLDMPAIVGRYYTLQMLNGWGETELNINERTFPHHPSGMFALCLAGSDPYVPRDALRIDVHARTQRVLCRIELGGDPAEALRLQRALALTPTGPIEIANPIEVATFANDMLPGVEAFDRASEILESEADTNAGASEMRDKVKEVELLATTSTLGRERVKRVVAQLAMPLLRHGIEQMGMVRNGWIHPITVGRYGTNYVMRTVANLVGIWANTADEVSYYGSPKLDGGTTYTLTFPPRALPDVKARYWSIAAIDADHLHVVPNALARYRLHGRSVRRADDGSLVLAFGPTCPPGVPEANWLPTTPGTTYNLTLRFYGAERDVASGDYFPPSLERAA